MSFLGVAQSITGREAGGDRVVEKRGVHRLAHRVGRELRQIGSAKRRVGGRDRLIEIRSVDPARLEEGDVFVLSQQHVAVLDAVDLADHGRDGPLEPARLRLRARRRPRPAPRPAPRARGPAPRPACPMWSMYCPPARCRQSRQIRRAARRPNQPRRQMRSARPRAPPDRALRRVPR